jgi:hypothetical protein
MSDLADLLELSELEKRADRDLWRAIEAGDTAGAFRAARTIEHLHQTSDRIAGPHLEPYSDDIA